MSYDWKSSAESPPQAAKIPAGTNLLLRIAKVIYGKKGGAPFKSKSGDPQIMAIFEDTDGNEASQMFTLSDKAAWVLARLLSRCGVDLDTLRADGIDPKHFVDKAICDKYLVGKSCRCNVTYNGEYANVEPCDVDTQNFERAMNNSSGPAGYEPIAEEDIPF